MAHSRSILLLPAVIIVTISHVTSDSFFILPSSDLACPGEFTGVLCLTLQEYVNRMQTPPDRVTLQLLPGIHFLRSSFSVSDMESFEMFGEAGVNVSCLSGTRIQIQRVETTHIRGITFRSCRANIENVDNLLRIEDSNFCGEFGTLPIIHPLQLSVISNVSIVRTSFRDSSALMITSASVHIKVATFSGNRLSRSQSPCSGTAIRCVGCTMTIEQSTFSDNRALCNDGRFGGDPNDRGGAISVQDTNLKVIQSTFTGNTVVQNGGAIHTLRGRIEVQNCTFRSNSATTGGIGAGLLLVNSLVIINESKFIANSAWGVFISGGSEVSVHGSRFVDNSAGGGGAALSIELVGFISIIDTTFIGNTAGGEGGALRVRRQNGVSLLLDGNTFTKNSAAGCAAIEIEGIGHHINFTANMVSNNTVTERNGVVCVQDSSISITNSSFRHHRIPLHGGGLYAQRTTVSIRESNFYNNSAGIHGGALYLAGIGSSLAAYHSNFEENESQNNGGAFYVSDQGITVAIQQCGFIKNKALLGNGGVLNFNGNDGSIVIVESDFINNTANMGGGVIHTGGRNITILLTGSTFTENSASACAVLEAEIFTRQVNLTASNFTRNMAAGMPTSVLGGIGGVVCASSDSVSVMASSFNDNTAYGHAGVLHVETGSITLQLSSFHNNRAGLDGGVMYSRNSPIILSVTQTSFTNNHAGRDGGVFFVGRAGSRVDVENSSFRFNSANMRGGVVAILGSVLDINETIIENNIAILGEVASACNSDVVISENIPSREDATNSLCMLYGDQCDECTFPETSIPTTAETTIVTRSAEGSTFRVTNLNTPPITLGAPATTTEDGAILPTTSPPTRSVNTLTTPTSDATVASHLNIGCSVFYFIMLLCFI